MNEPAAASRAEQTIPLVAFQRDAGVDADVARLRCFDLEGREEGRDAEGGGGLVAAFGAVADVEG